MRKSVRVWATDEEERQSGGRRREEEQTDTKPIETASELQNQAPSMSLNHS